MVFDLCSFNHGELGASIATRGLMRHAGTSLYLAAYPLLSVRVDEQISLNNDQALIAYMGSTDDASADRGRVPVQARPKSASPSPHTPSSSCCG